ncbi:MAG: NAD-dependent dehydratase, partial [Pleurocapsa sp.]
VGDTAHNYQVKEIAQTIAGVFKGCELSFGQSDGDNRSYRVSFAKINETLPGFKCDWNAQRGAQQFYDLFNRIDMSAETFRFRGFTRLKQLEYLIKTGQIDRNFFWKGQSPAISIPEAEKEPAIA